MLTSIAAAIQIGAGLYQTAPIIAGLSYGGYKVVQAYYRSWLQGDQALSLKDVTAKNVAINTVKGVGQTAQTVVTAPLVGAAQLYRQLSYQPEMNQRRKTWAANTALTQQQYKTFTKWDYLFPYQKQVTPTQKNIGIWLDKAHIAQYFEQMQVQRQKVNSIFFDQKSSDKDRRLAAKGWQRQIARIKEQLYQKHREQLKILFQQKGQDFSQQQKEFLKAKGFRWDLKQLTSTDDQIARREVFQSVVGQYQAFAQRKRSQNIFLFAKSMGVLGFFFIAALQYGFVTFKSMRDFFVRFFMAFVKTMPGSSFFKTRQLRKILMHMLLKQGYPPDKAQIIAKKFLQNQNLDKLVLNNALKGYLQDFLDQQAKQLKQEDLTGKGQLFLQQRLIDQINSFHFIPKQDRVKAVQAIQIQRHNRRTWSQQDRIDIKRQVSQQFSGFFKNVQHILKAYWDYGMEGLPRQLNTLGLLQQNQIQKRWQAIQKARQVRRKDFNVNSRMDQLYRKKQDFYQQSQQQQYSYDPRIVQKLKYQLRQTSHYANLIFQSYQKPSMSSTFSVPGQDVVNNLQTSAQKTKKDVQQLLKQVGKKNTVKPKQKWWFQRMLSSMLGYETPTQGRSMQSSRQQVLQFLLSQKGYSPTIFKMLMNKNLTGVQAKLAGYFKSLGSQLVESIRASVEDSKIFSKTQMVKSEDPGWLNYANLQTMKITNQNSLSKQVQSVFKYILLQLFNNIFLQNTKNEQVILFVQAVSMIFPMFSLIQAYQYAAQQFASQRSYSQIMLNTQLIMNTPLQLRLRPQGVYVWDQVFIAFQKATQSPYLLQLKGSLKISIEFIIDFAQRKIKGAQFLVLGRKYKYQLDDTAVIWQIAQLIVRTKYSFTQEIYKNRGVS